MCIRLEPDEIWAFTHPGARLRGYIPEHKAVNTGIT